MQTTFFVARAALVVALIYAQIHLLLKYGIEIGVPKALMFQVGIHALVTIIAPAPLRLITAVIAGWASAALAAGLAFAWVTLVIPLALMMGAFLHGEPEMLLQFLMLTAYCIIPGAIVYVAMATEDL